MSGPPPFPAADSLRKGVYSVNKIFRATENIWIGTFFISPERWAGQRGRTGLGAFFVSRERLGLSNSCFNSVEHR